MLWEDSPGITGRGKQGRSRVFAVGPSMRLPE
jgi:hypothetical protein